MNVIFHASAGTGKTYQVTNLYAALVLGRRFETQTADGNPVVLHEPAAGAPLDPRRILLMTFTDNAAAELRTRVTQLILKARYEAEAAGNSEEIETIVRVLRQLPAASICTIHSFCTSFLRERALDAGLPPGFSVLDQDAADELLDECAQAELLARLNRDPRPEASELPPYDPDFESFCAGVRVLGGEYGTAVTDIVKTLLRQAAGQGLALDHAEDMLPPPVHTVSRADFVDVLDALKGVRASRKDGLPPQAAEVFQTLEKNLRDFPTLGKNEALESFVAALTAGGSTSFRGKDLADISTRLKKRIDEVQVVARYRTHYAAIRAFARYAGAVARRYTKRKQELGVLDFDDLLTKTQTLLKSRAPILNPFDFIIVDEVQDTSRVQCEIIEALWNSAHGSLVICGDTKQSIYAWRNADPKVMPDLERAIQATPQHRKVALRASYRSKDSILDFVNALFKQVYGERYSDDEMLIASKEKNAVLPRKPPCVEFLSAPWEDDPPSGEIPDLETRTKAEMTAVAERIRLLVDGPSAWQPAYRYSDDTGKFAPADQTNAYRYSDILILLRRTTNQQTLEHVLRLQGIPYRISGRGKGLFARPEAIDTLLFLKVLTQPFDTIALIGFLRSPWIGLSDDSILQLGWKDEHFDEGLFADRVASADGEKLLAGEPAERLARARAILLEFRSKLDDCLPSEILRELIQRTGYDAVLSGTFRGTQRIANLRKLIDWIRRVERGGTVLLADVVRSLEENADTPPDIPEASLLDPEQNAVTIMTIHGAKGLTSRVVFVPELSCKPSNDSSWALLDKAVETPARLVVRTEDIARETTMTPGFDTVREAMREIRAAESKNVFYVAMTRARDLVVLSGATGDRAPAEWRSEIEKLLTTSPDAGKLLRRISYADITQAEQELKSPTFLTTPVALESFFATATQRYPGPIPSTRILRFPATTLSTYHNDPEEYAKTKEAAYDPFPSRPRQGTDKTDLENYDLPPERDTDEAGSYADFGIAGHTILEQLALNGWSSNVASLAQTVGAENGLSERDICDLKTRLEKTVNRMAGKLSSATEFKVEWPFAMLLEKAGTKLIVDGTVDLLCKSKDGSWHILDYKFSDEPETALRKKYGLQLNLYRQALQRVLKSSEPRIRTSLIVIGRSGVTELEIAEDSTYTATAVAAAEALDRLFHAENSRR